MMTERPRLTPAMADVRRAVRTNLADVEQGSVVLVALSGGPDSLALAAGLGADHHAAIIAAMGRNLALIATIFRLFAADGRTASLKPVRPVILALVLVPVGAVTQGMALLSWDVLPLGFLVGILSSAIPYSLEMVALRNMTSQNFSVFMSMEPAIAALAGFLILAELLTLWQWLAIGLVIVASLGSSLTSSQAKVPETS